MSNLVTRTAKLIPAPRRSKPLSGFATSYFYEPEPGINPDLGSLFVVIEVLGPSRQAEEVADLVIETVGHSYFNDDHKGSSSDQFEYAVKATNKQLSEYTSQGNAAWVGKMSAVVAVLSGQQLHLSQTGSAQAYLYRSGHQVTVTDSQGNKENSQPLKTFAHIAAGNMRIGDRLVFSTPALLHHIAESDLNQLVSDNQPHSVVAKLSGLLNNDSPHERIAAIVAEISTSELISQQILPSEQDTIEIGPKETVLDSAKATAAPVAKKALEVSYRGAQAFHGAYKQHVAPKLRSGALSAVQKLRKALRSQYGRQFALGLLVIVTGLIVWLSAQSRSANALDSLLKRYDAVVVLEQKAESQLENGDKTGAKTSLASASHDLANLKTDHLVSKLDKKLASRPHPESIPASLSGLEEKINSTLDKIDNLVKISSSLVVSITSKPSHFEFANDNIIAFDATFASIVDPASSKVRSITLPAGFGKAVATTASPNNDGVYVYTDQPALWFFKSSDASLTKQILNVGDWEAARAIASYAGNIYTLSAEQINKHVPTAGGFGAATGYLQSGQGQNVKAATALAIDGSVYAVGSDGNLVRYIQGNKHSTLQLSANFNHPVTLDSKSDGSQLVIADGTSKRIGIIGFDGTNLTFVKQYQLQTNASLLDLTYNPKTQTYFALLDNGQIVKFVAL